MHAGPEDRDWTARHVTVPKLEAEIADFRAQAAHWETESDLRSGIINHLQTMLADVRTHLAAAEREHERLLEGWRLDTEAINAANAELGTAYQARAAAEQRVAALTEALRETDQFLASVEHVHDHSGAMNATQLGRRDGYVHVRGTIAAALRATEGAQP